MTKKLREIRISKGISQTYLAKKLGFKNPSGYNNIESGRTKPSLQHAKIIADILEMRIEDIFF